MGFKEEIRDFLIEANELLANLDKEVVQLERKPQDHELVSSAFRAIHTIKGTSGFFGFDRLGALTHVTENLFCQVRDGHRELTPELISLILRALDEIRALLAEIESTGQEGPDRTAPLRDLMNEAYRAGTQESPNETPAAAQPKAGTATVGPLPEALAEIPSEVQEKRPGSGFQRLRPRRSPVAAPATPVTPSAAETQAVSATEALPKPEAASAVEVKPAAREPARAESMVETRGTASALGDSTIRVDVGLLNRLMNLVGELVLARNQLLQGASSNTVSLQQTSQRLNMITSELQEGVMKTRMQPIGVVWNKLPRVVRDLATQCGKKIRIEMQGVETELDKTIIEGIKDPLTHVVRNCCDHGIELPAVRLAKGKDPEGVIHLRAYHEGGVVNIEIADDGAGINVDRVKAKAIEKGLIRPEQAAQMTARDAIHLIFLPGFSTAAEVTNISGRGVGMDVVKSNIEKIGGNAEVVQRPEGGTTIRIKIPLTLAIIPGLVVALEREEPTAMNGQTAAEGTGVSVTQAGQQWKAQERFIIPQANLLELVRISAGEQGRRIEDVHGTPVFHHRGKLLPLLFLDRQLGRPKTTPVTSEALNIVVLQAEHRKIGLVVDRICDTQEIVVKPLGRQLKGLSCYVGATIMGDGRPALILDVVGLMQLGGIPAQSRPTLGAESGRASEVARPQKLLLFRTGAFERVAVPLALVDRLEEIDAANIKRAAGRRVLQYRGAILPLVSLPELLVSGQEPVEERPGMQQVVVFSDGRRRAGLLVDQILDIVEEAITARRGANAPGIFGSAIIGDHVTDLLDLEALLTAAGEGWMSGEAAAVGSFKRLLLVEGRTAARELLHGFLETSGFSTVSVGSLSEAKVQLQQQRFDVAITPIDISGVAAAGLEFLEIVRKDPRAKDMPVIGMLRPLRGSARLVEPKGVEGFDVLVYQDQREDLMNALTSLLLKERPGLQEVAR